MSHRGGGSKPAHKPRVRIVVPLWDNGEVKQPTKKRMHIVEGTDWKASIVALLESRSPYRPWRYGFGVARKGDPVAIVLHTDPRTVLTTLGRIGADGRPDRAVVDWTLPKPGLVDLDSLVMFLGFGDASDPRDVWRLRGDAATRLEVALTEAHRWRDKHMRFGHSSVAAARILLHSKGRCTGCMHLIDLTGEDARESFRIRTVDQPARDAPEVLIKEERDPPSCMRVWQRRHSTPGQSAGSGGRQQLAGIGASR